MQRGLSRAVSDLRARMEWSQEDLAREITREAAKLGFQIKPNQVCVSRWENREAAPSEEHRKALARLAARHKKTEDLAEYFRAPISAWRLAGYVQSGTRKDQSSK